jgi:hypothetical protein
VFRAVSDRPQWESLLPEELPRVDTLLEDPASFDPGRDALPSGDRPAVHTDRVLPAGDVLEGGISQATTRTSPAGCRNRPDNLLDDVGLNVLLALAWMPGSPT